MVTGSIHKINNARALLILWILLVVNICFTQYPWDCPEIKTKKSLVLYTTILPNDIRLCQRKVVTGNWIRSLSSPPGTYKYEETFRWWHFRFETDVPKTSKKDEDLYCDHDEDYAPDPTYSKSITCWRHEGYIKLRSVWKRVVDTRWRVFQMREHSTIQIFIIHIKHIIVVCRRFRGTNNRTECREF